MKLVKIIFNKIVFLQSQTEFKKLLRHKKNNKE